jgi:phosphoribosylaminoimidazole (AIR) synthetase
MEVFLMDAFLDLIREDINSTWQDWVMSEIGGFASVVDLDKVPHGCKDPILVQVMRGESVDASGYSPHDFAELGREVVRECTAPLRGLGCPISFLDYIGANKIRPLYADIVHGMAGVCRSLRVPIVGGETAELPVVHADNCLTVVGVLTVVMEQQDFQNHLCVYNIGIKTCTVLCTWEQGGYAFAQSIDGVGTKSHEVDDLSSLQRDVECHCRNDVVVVGARSVVGDFHCVDYHSHPGVFQSHQMDLVGVMGGFVPKDQIVDGLSIQPGDVVLGLFAIGMHTNGFSFAREVLLDQAGLELDELVPTLGCTVREEFSKPHPSYMEPILALCDAGVMEAAAHITGGGLPENVIRVLPEGCVAVIEKNALDRVTLPVFRLIQREGSVPWDTMVRTFNMGVGMALIVSTEDLEGVHRVLGRLGQQYCVLGRVEEGARGVKFE